MRREVAADVDAVREVTAAAFGGAAHSAPPVEPGGPPGEVALVAWLREDEAWIPALSLVAEVEGVVVGHALCSRAYVGEAPVLGLGPVSVLPARQRTGIGHALLHALLGAAEGRGESLVGLLGDPAYYGRFGFVPASSLGVEAPEPAWGDFFQARALGPGPHPVGTFRYAAPFDRLG